MCALLEYYKNIKITYIMCAMWPSTVGAGDILDLYTEPKECHFHVPVA